MNRQEFEQYWKDNYVEVTYEDVKEAYESCVNEAERHIFISDYEEAGAVSREDFIENLSENAAFMFQDSLTEAFYDKNPELYETAFEIFEEEQMNNSKENAAAIFHEEYNALYRKFLLAMFDTFFG